MPTPTSRSKILPARGSKANLDIALAAGDLLEGELCYAKDEDALYQVEAGVLVKVGGGLQPGDNVSELNNDAGYVTDAGVTQIVAGNNITIDPVGGTGAVTINSTSAGEVEEAPLDGNYYVRVSGTWVSLANALTALNDRIIDGGNFITGNSEGDTEIVDGGVFT